MEQTSGISRNRFGISPQYKKDVYDSIPNAGVGASYVSGGTILSPKQFPAHQRGHRKAQGQGIEAGVIT